MISFGDIVLTRFPFTDLSDSKMRPALVISRDNNRRSDVVLAFITSNTTAATADSISIQPDAGNGLKVPSIVRFDKLTTLEKRVIAGTLGKADPAFLAAAQPIFFGVFGFGTP